MIYKIALSILISISFVSCSSTQNNGGSNKPYANLDYWNDGKAEISSYRISQNRYNDLREGEMILVHVREDFLTDKQVKNESYTSNNSVPVLKRIEQRKFNTGMYDYTVFSSAFTPLNDIDSRTIKISGSNQEWCGVSYLQLNESKGGYKATQHSYFEKIGDRTQYINSAITEEEIFTRIRLAPNTLPNGEIDFVPAVIMTQLKHYDLKSYRSKVTKGQYSGDQYTGKNLHFCKVETPQLNRTLTIYYEQEAPHTIVAWEDVYPSAFDKEKRVTKALLNKTIKSAYWNKSGLADERLREELGLKY